jgi:acetyltransferase-like isoleucine patch superfamily enzyme
MVQVVERFYARYRAAGWWSSFDTFRQRFRHSWGRYRWLARQAKMGRGIEATVQIRCSQPLDEHLTMGKGTFLDRGAIIYIGCEVNPKSSIDLADCVYIAPYAFLGSCHRLEIGNDTMVGAHTYITTVNHVTRRKDIAYSKQGFEGADVRIGNNVWIGCHVTVLPGVTIEDHAIIGAGAVVTKNVPSGETWAGVPAKKIK